MLNVVSLAADCLGISANPTRDPIVLETLQGIGRVHGRRPEHVTPLWGADLKAMAIAVRFESNENVAKRNITFMTFLRGTGLRRLTAVQLELANVISIDHRGLEYWPGSTKADQLGKGGTKRLGRTSDPLTDPVQNLEALLTLRGTDIPGSLFPAMDKSQYLGR